MRCGISESSGSKNQDVWSATKACPSEDSRTEHLKAGHWPGKARREHLLSFLPLCLGASRESAVPQECPKKPFLHVRATFSPRCRLSDTPQPCFLRSPSGGQRGPPSTITSLPLWEISRGLSEPGPPPKGEATMPPVPSFKPQEYQLLAKARTSLSLKGLSTFYNQTLPPKYSLFQAPLPYLPLTKR